jgi:hypothetical protein
MKLSFIATLALAAGAVAQGGGKKVCHVSISGIRIKCPDS